MGARRRWVKGEVHSGRRPSERREKSGGQQGWRPATEARGDWRVEARGGPFLFPSSLQPHAAVGPSRSSRKSGVEEDDDATVASQSSISSTRSGSKVEAERSGCCGPMAWRRRGLALLSPSAASSST
uniref:Uncharacterized protein n=1 Tax=Oryza glumipatula TaxID=40148 RepID=A0A0E0ARY6_9ORYZ